MREGYLFVGHKRRFVDRVASAMHKLKLYKIEGRGPIKDSAGKEVGTTICVYGNGLIVRFLEWMINSKPGF